ncbi:MAG: ornithine carbamoyltransferase [Deltaproteobacteria bacterium]|nr:MAG: ornithine carbamoyltransferase [Deltaproteobacteria bacterium]
MTRHFLSLADWTGEELGGILDLAADLKNKQQQGEPHPLLAGKTLGMLFEKSSTRTRVSFEVGLTQLGGHAIFLSPRDTQIGRGEPIKDTARVLSRYVDAVMVRTFAQETVEELANWSTIPIINGLTDLLHPCQLMADLLTVKERFGKVEGLKAAWVGDGNNMANSWINAAAAFGFKLALACPGGYNPDEKILEDARNSGADILLTEDPREAVESADVVTTDVWASMGQEEEQAKREADFQGFMVDEGLMNLSAEHSIFMHCLPAHRGEEVSEGVLEGPHSVVWDQAENRLHAQKAILATLLT